MELLQALQLGLLGLLLSALEAALGLGLLLKYSTICLSTSLSRPPVLLGLAAFARDVYYTCLCFHSIPLLFSLANI